MPDNTQEPLNLMPPAPALSHPEPACADGNANADEELAQQELERISLSKAELRELAKKNPPLPKWFDEEEEAPF